MREDVRSYLKTIAIVLGLFAILAAVGFFALAALATLDAPSLSTAVGLIVALAGAALLLAAASGFVVVRRAQRVPAGREDLFVACNRSRSEAALQQPLRLPFSGLRRALGAPLIVGDAVKIKPVGEIRATLDSSGCLDNLPFMAEMERFCGKRARVYRVVDKVYDYGGKKDLRRIRDTVLLHDLRCDGAAHGGCQAECYLLWKTAWLEPAGSGNEAQLPAATGGRPGLAPVPDAPDAIYRCQYTQIVAASTPMSPRGIAQYLRPLVAGNVTLPAFATTLATLLFNTVQRLRRGTGFPWLGTVGAETKTPDLGLQPGERVRVKSAGEIARTLSKRGKNKGLWFDGDMLKHAGRTYTVRARVDKIIDDVTGKMLRMRSPCILLDGVDGSGEYLRFSAQHDYVFWREAWLERVDGPAPPLSSETPRPA
jgi:hypothetical protein